MIRPKSNQVTCECDSCRATFDYEVERGGFAMDAMDPPPGWAEITGFLDKDLNSPPSRQLLNRHICPLCLTRVGPLLRSCGLHVTVLRPASLR